MTIENPIISAPSIQLCSGRYFDFTRPEECNFDIYDIAHALSNIARFNGHTSAFYSVAQHSVLVADILPEPLRLAGLLHDAPEAFIGDMPRPLKRLLPDYAAIERTVEAAVFKKFGIDLPLPEQIKHADLVMLATERRDLMPNTTEAWTCLNGVEPRFARVRPREPHIAELSFLEAYRMLTNV